MPRRETEREAGARIDREIAAYRAQKRLETLQPGDYRAPSRETTEALSTQVGTPQDFPDTFVDRWPSVPMTRGELLPALQPVGLRGARGKSFRARNPYKTEIPGAGFLPAAMALDAYSGRDQGLTTDDMVRAIQDTMGASRLGRGLGLAIGGRPVPTPYENRIVLKPEEYI